MLLTIVGYVLALLAIAVVSPLLSSAIFRLIFPAIRRLRRLTPVCMALMATASAVAAVFVFIWVAGLFDIRLAYLMFFVPLVLSIRNDANRIDRARRGTTPVARVAGNDYDAKFQVKMEYGYLIGDIAGITLPLLFISRLPFV